MQVEHYTKAADLPADWEDRIGDNLYMRRAFLEFIESVDKYEKSYHVFRDAAGKIDTQFMLHTKHNYNLTMFAGLKTKLTMHFVHFPLSVARPGIIYGEATRQTVGAWLRNIKGYKMVLNVDAGYRLQGFARGLTCPRCVLKLKWRSFEAYMEALRSGYRRRYRRALAKSSSLKMYFLDDNRAFDQRLYALYEEVFENSRYKMEKLTTDFFRGAAFKIFVLADAAGPQGFVQLLPNGKELVFEFVGFNHANNHQYDIYIRLLLEIVRYGIDHGYETIDFGQTADEAKLKLGCKYEMLYALVHHSNWLINRLLHFSARFIEYKPLDDSRFHVFKTDGGDV